MAEKNRHVKSSKQRKKISIVFRWTVLFRNRTKRGLGVNYSTLIRYTFIKIQSRIQNYNMILKHLPITQFPKTFESSEQNTSINSIRNQLINLRDGNYSKKTDLSKLIAIYNGKGPSNFLEVASTTIYISRSREVDLFSDLICAICQIGTNFPDRRILSENCAKPSFALPK